MTLNPSDVSIPADVAESKQDAYVENYLALTRSTGRLMLFAGDQKIEHLHSDFYGPGISADDGDPRHLFEVAQHGTVGCLATQKGLIAQYGPEYPGVAYLMKLNSRTDLVQESIDDPYAAQLGSVQDAVRLRENGLRVLAVGYTVYLGSRYESYMLREAANIVSEAHKEGLVVVLWMYPRGSGVKDKLDPGVIQGACGVGAALGGDFVKVNFPHGFEPVKQFSEAVRAAGKAGVVCSGGTRIEPHQFLHRLHEQIHEGGAVGNATGRNIHQLPFRPAVRMCNAISAVTLADMSVEEAYSIFEGSREFEF